MRGKIGYFPPPDPHLRERESVFGLLEAAKSSGREKGKQEDALIERDAGAESQGSATDALYTAVLSQGQRGNELTAKVDLFRDVALHVEEWEAEEALSARIAERLLNDVDVTLTDDATAAENSLYSKRGEEDDGENALTLSLAGDFPSLLFVLGVWWGTIVFLASVVWLAVWVCRLGGRFWL